MKEKMVRKILLFCGILSPLLYAFSDWLSGLRWVGYSFRDQTISELAAIGAPSRPLFSALLVLIYLLFIAFGIGVWQSAGARHALRVVGGLLVALGVMALTVGQFVPMHLRGAEQGVTDILHLVEGGIAVLMVVAAIAIAATAFGRWFRLYAIATIIVMLTFGTWTGIDAPLIAENLPTPWIGVKERIFWYTYQLWFIVLALTLLRQPHQKPV